MDLMELATEERSDLVELLAGLSDEEWETPSLCEGWRVRDVAGHVISYDVLSTAGTLLRFLQGRLSVSRVNAIGVERSRALTPEQIVDQFRQHPRPTGLTSGLKGGIGLTDGLIHHQDIRRALDKPRQIPQERLAAALPFSLKAPTLSGRTLARGLRLVATDLDWETGSGPEVRGQGEALLMAFAGRAAVADELSGAGVGTWSSRLRSRA
jgi:uncharacterized protein (TIGR03083 family)